MTIKQLADAATSSELKLATDGLIATLRALHLAGFDGTPLVKHLNELLDALHLPLTQDAIDRDMALNDCDTCEAFVEQTDALHVASKAGSAN